MGLSKIFSTVGKKHLGIPKMAEKLQDVVQKEVTKSAVAPEKVMNYLDATSAASKVKIAPAVNTAADTIAAKFAQTPSKSNEELQNKLQQEIKKAMTKKSGEKFINEALENGATGKEAVNGMLALAQATNGGAIRKKSAIVSAADMEIEGLFKKLDEQSAQQAAKAAQEARLAALKEKYGEKLAKKHALQEAQEYLKSQMD